jgi:hypothetical protein
MIFQISRANVILTSAYPFGIMLPEFASLLQVRHPCYLALDSINLQIISSLSFTILSYSEAGMHILLLFFFVL